jgi:hypothetical protein
MINTPKLIVFLILLLTSFLSFAFEDNPNTLFDTGSNYTNESRIKWTPVENLQETCERESRKRGFGGFNYSIKACTFFDGNKCDIFTSKNLNMHTLGHEVRHCFQGNYHR